MNSKILRKFLLVLIISIPVFTYTDCRKQAKCGCSGDVLNTLTKVQATVYFDATGQTISFVTADDPYSTYNFCNPSQMFPSLVNSVSGDQLMVSGEVFWDCNYLYQASSSSYASYVKVFVVQGTELSVNLYGKK